jgi:hypothetical protein
MFLKRQIPSGKIQWGAEHTRLQGELDRVRAEIKAEQAKRSDLAIATQGAQDPAADKAFDKSFVHEEVLRRESEKLTALVTHARQQIVAAENAEREAADLLRRKKLAAAYARQREIAARLDAAFSALAVEARAFDEACNTIRNLTGQVPRRIPRAIALAAKAAGLRELLEISIPGQGIALVDQIQGPASTVEAA